MSEAVIGEEKNTTVAIRLRPLNEREKAANQGKIWRCVPSHNSVTQTTRDGNPLPDAKGTFFTYDRIFDERSSTQEVYNGVARELVHSVIRGLNSTIFAYGQTSSGKTFTMQGGDDTNISPGIVQLAARDLFSLMGESHDRVFLVRVSYLEIYQEDIRDLLNPNPVTAKLQVREDPRKGVYIDAVEEVLSDFNHVLRILASGEQRRHVGCTEMNSRSSRSHTIFRLVVESQQQYVPDIHASADDVDPAVLVATLNLVDLAGSESVRHTGATGLRQKEGGNINRSLLTLSQVIQKLSQGGTSHVNYRDSKLTRILQPSLSGNASMAIICCATPAEGFLEETRSTLQFASRAKDIKTRAIVNEVLDNKAQLRRMSQELAALRHQQGKVESEKAEQSAKIERLQNLIINMANRPAAAVAAAVTTASAHGMNAEDGLIVDISPRSRRTKRSRETWCPGESGVPLLQGLVLPERLPGVLEEDDFDRRMKRRSATSSRSSSMSDTAQSPGQIGAGSKPKPPRTPASSRGRLSSSPALMSPARSRAEQQVMEMRERLASIQEERDAMAAEVEAARVAETRVSKLEAEVVELKASLESAKATAVTGASGEEGMNDGFGAAHVENDRQVEEIASMLEEAEKAKASMKAELDEFCEYTDKKDAEAIELVERLARTEQELRQKEAELKEIRIAEERDERENAFRVEELETRVIELEGAIKERDAARQSKDGMNLAGAGDEDGGEGESKTKSQDDEMSAMKHALEECQKELAAHKARAEGELEELMEEMSSTEARLQEEKEAVTRAAQQAADAVAEAAAMAEAVAAREAEATITLKARVAALESERAEIEDEVAELRALNDEATALLADNQEHRAMQTDGEAQTEAEEVSSEAEAAQEMIAAAQEVSERDRALVALHCRVEELERSLGQVESEQHELEARSREKKEEAEIALRETIAGQRRAEDALSLANQSQLEMRCRLEEAIQQVTEAEAARDDMEVAGGVLNSEKDRQIEVLTKKVKESESQAEAALQAEASASALAEQAEVAANAAAEEATRTREKLEVHRVTLEAKDVNITELEALVSRLKATSERQVELEEGFQSLQDDHRRLVSEKEVKEAKVGELAVALAIAQAEKESVAKAHARLQEESSHRDTEQQARVQQLSEQVTACEADAESARAELAGVRAAEEQAEYAAVDDLSRELKSALEELVVSSTDLEKERGEISRLEQETSTWKTKFANLQSEFEVKNQELDRLEEAVRSFEVRLAVAVEAASDTVTSAEKEAAIEVRQAHEARESASAQRIADLEDRLQEAKGTLEKELAVALEAAEAEAKTIIEEQAARLKELESKMSETAGELADALAIADESASEAKDLAEKAGSADAIAAELESVRQGLSAREQEAAEAVEQLEAELEKVCLQFAEASVSLTMREQTIADIREQANQAVIVSEEEKAKAIVGFEKVQMQFAETNASLAAKEETIAELRELVEQSEQASFARGEESAEAIAQLESQLEEVRGEFTEAKASLVSKEEAITELQDQVEQGAAELKEKSSKATAQLESELEEVRVHFSEAKVSLTAKEEAIVELQDQVEQAMVALKEAEGMEATTQLEAELEEIRAEFAEAKASLTAKEEAITELRCQADQAAIAREQETSETMAQLESELEEVRVHFSEAKVSLTVKEEAIVELQDQVEQTQQAAASREEKSAEATAELEAELEKIRGEFAEAKLSSIAKEEAIADFHKQAEQAAAALKEAEGIEATANLEAELGKVRAQFAEARASLVSKEHAIAELHEQAEQAAVASEEETAKTMTELEEIHVQLSEAEVSLASKEEMIAELQDQVVKAVGAREETAGEAIAQLEAELEQARVEFAEANALLREQAEQAVSASEKETAEAMARIEEIRIQYAEAKVSSVAKDKTITELHEELEQAAVEREEKSAEARIQLEAELEEMRVKFTEAKVSLTAREETVAELHEQAEQLVVALKEAQEPETTSQLEVELEEIRTQFTEVSASLATKEKTIVELHEQAEQAAVAREEASMEAVAKLEVEAEEIRLQFARAKASVATQEEVIVELREQAEQAAFAFKEVEEKAQVAASDAAAAAVAIIEEKSAEIITLKENLQANEGVQDDLALALDESESLSKEVLDLTDELMEKDARISEQAAAIAELKEQLTTITAKVGKNATTGAAHSLDSAAHDSEMAESVVRRLKVELDRKCSELDSSLKEADTVRAELKEMKALFNAAGQEADAAGADEQTLRKRLSQLVCENGLLKGEKDRREALDALAKTESRSAAVRASVEIDRLERELEAERTRANKAAAVAAEGNNTKSAIVAMEARLSEFRQERSELQETAQRSVDRYAEAESQAETLRERVAQLEVAGRNAGRSAIAALETRVDELEEEIRRTEASKVEVEAEARQHANRAKRVQGEVEMMRSEYEIMSEEAAELRGRVAASEHGTEELEHDLAEAREASKAMEEQLRHRLETQVAEAESMRQRLAAAHERAEAEAQAAEQRDRDGADEKTAALLEEMEGFMEEKLAAEAQVQGMKAELSGLQESLRSAEQRAAQEQSMVIQAAQQRMEAFEEETDAKDRALEELRASLEVAHEAEKVVAAEAAAMTDRAEETARQIAKLTQDVQEAKARGSEGSDELVKALNKERQLIAEGKIQLLSEMVHAIDATADEEGELKTSLVDLQEEIVSVLRAGGRLSAGEGAAANTTGVLETTVVSALKQELKENAELIKVKNARINRLEEVKLTVDQVKKLSRMKADGKAAAAENKELKKKIATMEQRAKRTSVAAASGGGSSSPPSSSLSPAEVDSALSAAAATKERVEELTGVKETLLRKVRGYGARINELEMEHSRVRSALEDGGFSLPEGSSLGEIVLDVVGRATGAAGGGSFVSTATDGHGVAMAAAVAVAERHHAELKESREVLRQAEVSRVTLQEQMRAGVSKYRTLEAQEASVREGLEAVQAEMREMKETAAKKEEKSGELAILEEENLQLYKENKELMRKLKALQDELVAASAQCNKNTPKRPPLTPRAANVGTTVSQGQKSSAAKLQAVTAAAAVAASTGERRGPVTAAERRRQSVALLHGDPGTDEGGGECNQS